MRKRIPAIAVVLGLAVVLFIALSRTPGPPEPIYLNKPYQAWLKQYNAEHWVAHGFVPANSPEAAINAIGTNAITTLLRMIQKRQWAWQRNCILLLRRQSW